MMIPVASNHTANVVYRNVLPSLIADMLPARYFFKNQKPEFVASIKEMARLRIMRRAYDIALKVLTKDLRIAALHTTGHCLPHIRESLVTIETAQLDYFSVQLKAMVGKLCFAKTEAAGIFVNDLRSSKQANAYMIKIPVLKIP